jgi:glycosyltransferase involved in cell wall biosynthesis
VIRRVLGLGTFPAVKPIHGGQRRVAAFRIFYQTIGIEYVYTCIYDSDAYAREQVGPHDIPLIASEFDEGPIPLIGDILAGRQGASHEASFRHFLDIVGKLQPDALQLEHPFMWPLAKRLREATGAKTLPLIYSSHNVEAPLKDAILLSGGVPVDVRKRICDGIEQMEAEICREAALVVCVTAAEQRHYLRYCSPDKIIVVPNGVDRPPPVIQESARCREVFQGRPFVFMVGSAYPPNIEGACRYVFRDGTFMVPPVKSIVVCGGVCDGILRHPSYQRFLTANSLRVHFFPEIDDAELWGVKTACHAVALPIDTGGGSNLKTAEALALGKWVIATPVAMRGYENFMDAEGLIIANDTPSFRRAVAQALRSSPLAVHEASRAARKAVYWDCCFEASGLADRLAGSRLADR